MNIIFKIIICSLISSNVYADGSIWIDGQTNDGHIIQDDGTTQRQQPILNFTGTSVANIDSTSQSKTVIEINDAAGNATLDTVFLKLDTTNDPLTGDLNMGGNSLIGDTVSGGDLLLQSTSNATTGLIGFTSLTQGLIWNEDKKALAIGDAEFGMTVGGITKDHALTTHSSGGANAYDVVFHRHSNTSGPFLAGARSRGSEASSTVVQDGDNLLDIFGLGFDGTDYEFAASIMMDVDGTPGAGDMPGRIVFLTTPDGSGTLVEALRISQDQSALFSANVVVDGSSDIIQNRIQGNGTQTNFLSVMEQSDGTDVHTTDNSGNVVMGDGSAGDSIIEFNDNGVLVFIVGNDDSENKLVIANGVLDTTNDLLLFDGSSMQSTGGSIVRTDRITVDTVLTSSHYKIFGDTDGGAITATLPAGVHGTEHCIYNTGSSGNNLSITPDSSELLFGANSNFDVLDKGVECITYETTEGWW